MELERLLKMYRSCMPTLFCFFVVIVFCRKIVEPSSEHVDGVNIIFVVVVYLQNVC